jgi:hypothetical protein
VNLQAKIMNTSHVSFNPVQVSISKTKLANFFCTVLRGFYQSINKFYLISFEMPQILIFTQCICIIPLSPSQRRVAPFRALARGEGTNSARLFTPGEREAITKSKVHQ